MARLLLLLFLLLLTSCFQPPDVPLDTNWDMTPYDDLPGIVAITTGWGKSHLCTGVLIHPSKVLTAAHCLHYPAEDMYIVYNCSNIRSDQCKRVPVSHYEIHPLNKLNYVSTDDLGIIIINPILDHTLATISQKESIPLEMSLLMAGFGRRGDVSGILYSGMGRVTQDYTNEFISGRRGWMDPHPGDSGGPAYILENGEMKVVGILSRGIMKNNSFTGYAIYTKPALYLDWIWSCDSVL